jgi:hypothetical protein
MRYAVILAIALLSTRVLADSWPEPKPAGMASPGGNVVVRIVPGASIGDVYGFGGSPKGQYATAIFYRLNKDGEYARYQDIFLLNPVAPVDFAVSDNGELVTLDNWHNLGVGKIIVVYRPNGKVLRSYNLAEIYGNAEIQKLSASVSSISWRCPMAPILEPRSASIEFADVLGNSIGVNLKTGELSKHPLKEKFC